MSLRTALLVVGGIAAVVGIGQLLAGTRGGTGLLVFGAVAIVGTVFERWRYRKTPPAGARWEHTGERFEDPITAQRMEVLYDPLSGERHYVPVDTRAGRD